MPMPAVTISARDAYTIAARHTYEAKFGAASWRAAADDTLLRQHLYRRVQFWIGLLLASPGSVYSRYWRNGTVPQLTGRGARRSRVDCPGSLRAAADQDSASYCDALWPVKAAELCAAYVIGIGGEWTFTRYSLSKGCEVHAYDPTVQLRGSHRRSASRMRKTHFHFAGLGGMTNIASSSNSYGTIEDARLMTLDQMVASRPGAAPMRVLTIDCEGCEWAAIEHLAQNATAAAALRPVKLLMLELHVSPSMIPPTPTQFTALFDFLIVREGFRLWALRTNDGYPFDQKVADFLGVGGLNAGLCCYELAFVR